MVDARARELPAGEVQVHGWSLPSVMAGCRSRRRGSGAGRDAPAGRPSAPPTTARRSGPRSPGASACVPRSTTRPPSRTTISSTSFESGQPVGDEQGRPTLGHGQEVGGQRVGGRRLEVLRRLVEHQDREVGQQRAGDGDPLALAAREPPAPSRPTAVASPSGSPSSQRPEPDAVEDAVASSASVAERRPIRRFSAERRVEEVGSLLDQPDDRAGRRRRRSVRAARRRAWPRRRRPGGSARARPPASICPPRSARRARRGVPGRSVRSTPRSADRPAPGYEAHTARSSTVCGAVARRRPGWRGS